MLDVVECTTNFCSAVCPDKDPSGGDSQYYSKPVTTLSAYDVGDLNAVSDVERGWYNWGKRVLCGWCACRWYKSRWCKHGRCKNRWIDVDVERRWWVRLFSSSSPCSYLSDSDLGHQVLFFQSNVLQSSAKGFKLFN